REGEHAQSQLGRGHVRAGREAGVPDRWVRLLVGLWHDRPLRHLPEATVPGEALPAPDLEYRPQRLFPHRQRLARVDAEPDLLVRAAAPGAELDPPIGEVVDHR